ncbi:MAG: M23 family metallopeptidase [Deltaproteobacteria bacterium]|uniref:M23 family metallopeptidase n=1 Tax=Candidatus Zymogenus saltonus TaxID=2844893 RepID=A0A9D8PMP6_9DELT|nr:M23 family metallopeptidase [Candidatus Zymogenus saltonus]
MREKDGIYFTRTLKAVGRRLVRSALFFAAISVMTLAPGISSHSADLVCPGEMVQGEIVVITINGEGDIVDSEGLFDSRRIYFNPSSRPYIFFGLLSADLTAKPVARRLTVTVRKSDGTKELLGREIKVKKGDFKTQYLTLEKKWVHYSDEDMKRIREDNRALAALYKTETGDRLWSKPFIMPLTGRISSDFGLRRFINGEPRASHSGIDIVEVAGTPVAAPNDGRVALVREMFFSGLSLFIDHGQGLYTMFFHLSEVAVKEGDTITRGETIAFVGATGRVTGAHLHFGVRHTGNKVSPWDLVNLKIP